MKRLLALLLCLALLGVLPGFAEETVPAGVDEPYVFTLRNGIQWGMSFEDVKATEWADLEITPDVYDEELATSGFEIENVAMSNYRAEFATFFVSGQLAAIGYGLNEPSDAVHAYLLKALGSKYGELTPDMNRRIDEVLTLLNTGSTLEIDQYVYGADSAHLVTLPDGTVIALVYQHGGPEQLFVYYFAVPLLNELFGIYNTFGL